MMSKTIITWLINWCRKVLLIKRWKSKKKEQIIDGITNSNSSKKRTERGMLISDSWNVFWSLLKLLLTIIFWNKYKWKYELKLRKEKVSTSFLQRFILKVTYLFMSSFSFSISFLDETENDKSLQNE